MKSAELIKLLNETSYPDEFLTSLEAVGFAIDAITEEGDSIFHLLALSKINYTDDLSNYLEAFTHAGADINECADLLLNDPRVEYIITNDMKIA